MAYGHAERNLVFIRRLEAETRQLLASLDQPDAEQSAWLRESTIGSAAAMATEPTWTTIGGAPAAA
jgi:hypothetical protein